MSERTKAQVAVRAVVRGMVQGVGYREATRRRARELSAMGWVRNDDDGAVRVHAEGSSDAVEGLMAFLGKGPRGASVDSVETEAVEVEGHEQFAIRGVSAGGFVVRELAARGQGYELELEVDGAMRVWVIPKGPSMDPAAKRFAIESTVRSLGSDSEPSTVWDRGAYEQGGRVAWPEAIERGHAVFVLHGGKLRGGFALQRIRAGAKPQWLLIKRRDDQARPGSDVTAEGPHGPKSGAAPGES